MVKQHNCGFCLFVANNEEQWDIEERKMFNFLWLTYIVYEDYSFIRKRNKDINVEIRGGVGSTPC